VTGGVARVLNHDDGGEPPLEEREDGHHYLVGHRDRGTMGGVTEIKVGLKHIRGQDRKIGSSHKREKKSQENTYVT